MSISIFFCYAHEDEALLKQLKTHLIPLQRQKIIDLWYDRDISAGMEWEQEISHRLNAAQIILLLVSPDFMASDYCYGIEMQRALERHQRGEARVIPIIVRHVYWQGILGNLQALPKDGLPITDPDWSSVDRALYKVVYGIQKVIKELTARSSHNSRTKLVEEEEELHSPSSTNSPQTSVKISQPELTEPVTIQKSHEFTLIRSFEGNSGIVWSVSLNAKGTMLASGNNDTTIDIWDIDRNELDATLMGYSKGINETPIVEFGEIDIRQLDDTFRGHKEAVICVAFSPIEDLLVSGSDDKTIKVWDLSLQRTLKGHKEDVNCINLSPDGQTIISGSEDRRIKVWYTRTGHLRRTLIGHSGGVNSVVISANEQIISGSNDKTIKVWDLEDGNLLRTLEGHSGGVNSVAISSDGQILVSGSEDKTIKLWNPNTGNLLRTLEGHSGGVNSVAISADGVVLASSDDKSIKLWNPRTGQLIFTINEISGGINSIAINTDGRMLAYNTDETIKIWRKK